MLLTKILLCNQKNIICVAEVVKPLAVMPIVAGKFTESKMKTDVVVIDILIPVSPVIPFMVKVKALLEGGVIITPTAPAGTVTELNPLASVT